MTMKKLLTITMLMASASIFADSAPYALQPLHVSEKLFVNPLFGIGEGAGDDDVGFAFGGALGYRFNSLVMAEFDIIRTPRGSDSSILFTVGPRITANLNNTWSVYAKIGLGAVYNTGDNSAAHLATMLGFGGKMAINSAWGLSSEITGSVGSDASTYSLLFGPYFRF
jgi:hypothetical protein